MSGDEAMRALAARFFDSVEAGDLDGLAACYHPEACIWHNTDGLETTRADNVETLRGFVARIPTRRYRNRRVQVFEGGFVQQHDLHGTRKDGAEVVLPACIVCQVRDGVIVRLDEYFDSAHVARFRAV